jgi:hypothetical protein
MSLHIIVFIERQENEQQTPPAPEESGGLSVKSPEQLFPVPEHCKTNSDETQEPGLSQFQRLGSPAMVYSSQR